MPVLGLIEVAFDPVFQVGDLAIRWQTVGVTVALLVALVVAAAIANYLPPRAEMLAGEGAGGGTGGAGAGAQAGTAFPDAPPAIPEPGPERLRLDDLAYIVLGIVPGAVIGGRLMHGVVFWDAYAQDPGRLLDPGLGSLSLLGAVLGGAISAAYVASLLDAPIRRWADAAAVPLLIALGLGKIGQFLGGSGQGAPFDGDWAVAFVGDGPWHSPNPDIGAHPAQVYEALWVLVGMFVLLRFVGPGRDLGRIVRPPLSILVRPARGDGLLFSSAIAWFLLGRVLVGFSWRDDIVVGPLNAEQSVALAILLGVVIGFAVRGARGEQSRVAEYR